MKNYLIITCFSLGLTFSTFAQNWFDESCPIENKVTHEEYASSKENNRLSIVLNQEGDLMVNEVNKNGLSEIKFKEMVYNFIVNPSGDKTKANSPKQAIIGIGTYNKENSYAKILDYIREVYLYTWDTEANDKYGEAFGDLNCKKREKVRSKYPYNVLTLDKKEKKPKMIIGVPSFQGDVIDN